MKEAVRVEREREVMVPWRKEVGVLRRAGMEEKVDQALEA